jgi:hypothetical protein
MKILTQTLLVAALGAMSATAAYSADAPAAAPASHPKNWTPPSGKIYAQKLSEQIMKQHPELLSVTFHGTPPGMTDQYTMFAGSYLDRIGNADDPDDIDISKKGITIVDPRWHRPNDTVQKFVMMLPLRDAKGNNIGEIVLAYKNDAAHTKSETQFFLASTHLRDALAKQIPTFGSLFDAAN